MPRLVSLLLCLLLPCGAGAQSIPPLVTLVPSLGTSPTASNADDPAIWIHPSDPARSVVIGTDKGAGIYVWDLAGQLLQHLPQGTRTNNVDLRSDVAWGGGRADVVVANLRVAGRLAVFLVNRDYDPALGDVLVQIADRNSSGNAIQSDSYGLGLYRRPADAALFLFERPKESGEIRQYRLDGDRSGGVTVSAVRDLDYGGGVAEGMVADDELGFLYVAEETRAIHKYHADPGESTAPLASFAQDDGILGDREGMALYLGANGTGYLLLSDQYDSLVKVYERQGSNTFVTTLDTQGAFATDGLDATSLSTPEFPRGFFVTHDDTDSNFELYDWRDLIDAGLDGGPSAGSRRPAAPFLLP